jgi:CheY-like chemotaxis protein
MEEEGVSDSLFFIITVSFEGIAILPRRLAARNNQRGFVFARRLNASTVEGVGSKTNGAVQHFSWGSEWRMKITTAGRKKPGRILVVEDNTDSRDILAKLLRMCGYEVNSASDGESGYEAALREVPDLIITDINMPVMDGIQLLKKVREEGLLARTAVLVVTAFGDEAAREAIEAGADASAAKPFDFDGFIDTVESLLFRHRVSA